MNLQKLIGYYHQKKDQPLFFTMYVKYMDMLKYVQQAVIQSLEILRELTLIIETDTCTREQIIFQITTFIHSMFIFSV